MIYAENILICIAVPLILVMFFLKGTTRLFIASLLMGMGTCLIAAYISGYLCFLSKMSTEDFSVFASPIVEEIFKFLPLLFYLIMAEPEDDHFFLSGLGIGAGFATFENCCYILSSGADSLPYILVRGMSVGVMHIVSVLALTIGLIFARRLQVLSVTGVLGAISLSMIFHGLYNLLVSEPGVSSYIGYMLPLLTTVFIYIAVRNIRKRNSSQ